MASNNSRTIRGYYVQVEILNGWPSNWKSTEQSKTNVRRCGLGRAASQHIPCYILTTIRRSRQFLLSGAPKRRTPYYTNPGVACQWNRHLRNPECNYSSKISVFIPTRRWLDYNEIWTLPFPFLLVPEQVAKPRVTMVNAGIIYFPILSQG